LSKGAKEGGGRGDFTRFKNTEGWVGLCHWRPGGLLKGKGGAD